MVIMIVCSGEDYSADKIKKYAAKADYIIACDGGCDILCKCGIKPDMVLGDMDSTQIWDKIENSGWDVMRFPREKDYTDSELAIQKALEMKPEHIYMFASTGSYVDHSLVNIISLVRNVPICEIVTSNAVISYKTASFSFENGINRRFSLFPITSVQNIRLLGAKYQYPKSDLAPWEFSLGNEGIAETVRVAFDSGSMILILFDN